MTFLSANRIMECALYAYAVISASLNARIILNNYLHIVMVIGSFIDFYHFYIPGEWNAGD